MTSTPDALARPDRSPSVANPRRTRLTGTHSGDLHTPPAPPEQSPDERR